MLSGDMTQKSKPMTTAQKAKLLSDKQDTLAILSEIIRLRHAVEGKQSTDGEIFMEAGKSLKTSGSYLPKIQKNNLNFFSNKQPSRLAYCLL